MECLRNIAPFRTMWRSCPPEPAGGHVTPGGGTLRLQREDLELRRRLLLSYGGSSGNGWAECFSLFFWGKWVEMG